MTLSSVKIKSSDLLVVAIVIGLALLAYFNIEAYEEEVTKAWSQEAQNEDFLAMKMHLENFDLNVELADNVDLLFSTTALNPILPAQNDIVIMGQSEITISSELSSRLLYWIDQGGHAVVDLQSYEDASTFATNQFLKTLGVSTQLSEDEKLIDSAENMVTPVMTPDFEQINVNVYSDIYIDLEDGVGDLVYAAAPYEANIETEPTIVQLEYGEGLITLMTDVYVWENRQISDNDNALWLYEIVKGAETVFVFSYRDPIMWYQIIAQYSPAFYWVLLFTVLLFAWYNAIRFGAVVSVSHHVMTFFSQHVKAAGEYYWASDQQHKLIEEVRLQVKDEIAFKLSRQNLSDEDMIKALSKISLLPHDTIRQLMFDKLVEDNTKLSQGKFTKLMQGLQTLRKMI